MNKYAVKLSQEEREELLELTSAGTISVRKLKRSRILLLADEGDLGPALRIDEIAKRVETSAATVSRIRKRYAEEGLEQAIIEKPRAGAPRRFNGDIRAKVTALACSDAPKGYGQWSLRLLADKMVEMEYVETISHMTIQDVLKKTT
jgi:transposase